MRSTVDAKEVRSTFPPASLKVVLRFGGNRMIVTAVLSTGIVVVKDGLEASRELFREILRTDHIRSETIMYVGDAEIRSTKRGPQPDHQLRISVRPSAGLAAINYMDNNDPVLGIANSYNASRPLPEVDLIFNGQIGTLFPRTALIPIALANEALNEWVKTRRRPENIEWRPYDPY